MRVKWGWSPNGPKHKGRIVGWTPDGQNGARAIVLEDYDPTRHFDGAYRLTTVMLSEVYIDPPNYGG